MQPFVNLSIVFWLYTAVQYRSSRSFSIVNVLTLFLINKCRSIYFRGFVSSIKFYTEV